MLRLREIIYEIYVQNTGQSAEQIAEDCERNKWLGAEEMLEYGLIDTVLEHLPADAIPHDSPRNAGTSIYFLLPAGVRSKWHRVASDELWIHQYGDSLELAIRGDEQHLTRVGSDGELQAVVPAGHWQSAEVIDGEHGYALVCCVVVPGFDFADFEMEQE